MKYFIKGGDSVDLSQKDFIASGGFGKVYKKNNFAYKIYDNPSNMLPIEKISELAVLKDQDIIKPERIITNSSKEFVGYTMRYVKGSPICKMFTHTFKKNNKITDKICLSLLSKFYTKIEHVHSNNILLVDVNELNFLVNDSFNEIYFIDTDGYQTKSFKATGIMDSIRDRHCQNNDFNENTDWFSWGILACQLITGLHPYRGGHPDFDNIDLAKRMDARMIKNISIFNSKTKLPPFIKNFDNIPSALKQWFISVFENGKRIKPPKDFDSVIILTPINVKEITGTNLFDISLLYSFKQELIKYKEINGDKFALLNDKLIFNDKSYNIPNVKSELFFNVPSSLNKPFVYYIENETLKCFDCIYQTEIECSLKSTDIFQVDDRIYYVNKDKFYEIEIIKLSNKVIVESNSVGNALDIPNATKSFDGTLMQNMLGRHYFSINPKSRFSYQIGIKELDSYTVIDAKYEKNVLIVSAITRKGINEKFVIRFNSNYTSYSLRKISNVQNSDVNFTVNQSGICIFLVDDSNIEIFSNNSETTSVKSFNDQSIDTSMILTSNASKVMFVKDKSVYSISVKN
jgi:hypothetical protein